jgi:hypothetical protein
MNEVNQREKIGEGLKKMLIINASIRLIIIRRFRVQSDHYLARTTPHYNSILPKTY